MLRTYNYPLRPNKKQEKEILHLLQLCRHLYNGALEERRSAYKKLGKAITKYDQHKELTEVRAQDPEYGSVSVAILRSALDRLDKSYRAAFRRCKSKSGKPGFPRFRGRNRYRSFGFPTPTLNSGKVRVPNLGWVRFHEYRQLPEGAEVRYCNIIRRPTGKWIL